MFLILYYDPGTNRIEIEELSDKLLAENRIVEIRDAGASTVKLMEIQLSSTLIEWVRT